MTEILADKFCNTLLCTGFWLRSLTVKVLHSLTVVCFSELNFKKIKNKKSPKSCCFHRSSEILHLDTSSFLGWFVSTPCWSLQATAELHGITISSLWRLSLKCKTRKWQTLRNCKRRGHTPRFPLQR